MPSSAQSKKGSRRLGMEGEQTAAKFLEGKGYLIKERNYRCKEGEIDIIAVYEEYLVFIEVKSRRASRFQVDPFISITRAKREKLRLLGEMYLHDENILDKQPRFDAIGVIFHDEMKYSIEHIENAF